MYNVFEVLNWLRTRNIKDLISENVNAEPLTQMKAMELLYYIQGACSAKYNTRLDKDFKENLFEETFLENKSSMDWLKDK